MPGADLLRAVRSARRGTSCPHHSPVTGSPGSWTPRASSRRSARSGCTWPPRARPPRRSGPAPRRCSGSPPPACAGRPAGPAGSRPAGRMCSGGWSGCWTGTAARTPATSSARCGSSSSGWPPRRRSVTRWPGYGHRTSPTSPCRSSPPGTCSSWSAPASAGRSSSAATPP